MKYANPLKKTRVIASTKGHAVEFPGRAADGTVTFVHVPHAIEQEVIAAGLQPESEAEEREEVAAPKRPESAEAIKDVVYQVFDILVGKSEREDFSGNGMPKPEAVNKLLGWPISKNEIRDLWTAYQAESAERSKG